MNQLVDEGKVSLNTVEDFEKFKQHMAEQGTPTVVFAGTLDTEKMQEVYKETLSYSAPTPTEVKDPDGEIVNIENLKLVLCGSIREELPAVKPEAMRDFAVAVARSATYTQRNLPFWQKMILLWKLFCELFFNKSPIMCNYDNGDPYMMVAYQWYRKQQVPAPMKMRLKLFLRRLRDMFVFTHSIELIDTYGMPGFQSTKKLIQTF